MDVRISKPMYAALKPILSKKPFEEDGRELEYSDHFWLELGKFSTPILKKLASTLPAHESIRGVKTLHRDVLNWIEASESPDVAGETTARSVRQACDLLIEYIRSTPRRHLYKRLQEGNEGVSLCYYVEKIEFNARQKGNRNGREVPEHIDVSLIYEEFGIQKNSSFILWPNNCLGQSPRSILLSKQFMVETESLRANHLNDITLYSEYKDLIGKQFLGVGLADDKGIDGNDEDDDDDRYWWRSTGSSNLMLDKDGEPSRIVIDVFRESSQDRTDRNCSVDTWFWRQIDHKRHRNKDGEIELDEDDLDDQAAESRSTIDIPIHPYVAAFDLRRHKRLRIHVGNITPYQYDKSIRSRLILPARNSSLIDILLVEKESKFRDIIKGKSGGTIILCQGSPGTGKTLTAEVYAEALERPLYTVQCSQLGTDPDGLESNLLKVLARGRRWGAVMLLDEADVYVTQRGTDLTQNAIVGVFLRVLEYQSGILFLTTNRGDLVDDAILSRCTARVPYSAPEPLDQAKIWEVLSQSNKILLPRTVIASIVKAHPRLSGRDIKNLLKLAAMVSHDRKVPITADLIEELKQFKPTCGDDG